jgi:hypothetical protein
MIKKYADYTELPDGLAEVAQNIYENDEDYGRTFYHPDGRVFVCLGDSNDEADEITEQLEMIDEVEHIEIEHETYPEFNEGWFAIEVKTGDLIPWNEGAEHLLYQK